MTPAEIAAACENAGEERKVILRRLNAARKGLFPKKTCPASRHVHIIVEALLDPKSDMHRTMAGYEPEHIAGSIASVLEGLWNARRWMKYENGKWVPDVAAIMKAVS